MRLEKRKSSVLQHDIPTKPIVSTLLSQMR
jgi:hypothetical protein